MRDGFAVESLVTFLRSHSPFLNAYFVPLALLLVISIVLLRLRTRLICFAHGCLLVLLLRAAGIFLPKNTLVGKKHHIFRSLVRNSAR